MHIICFQGFLKDDEEHWSDVEDEQFEFEQGQVEGNLTKSQIKRLKEIKMKKDGRLLFSPLKEHKILQDAINTRTEKCKKFQIVCC